MSLSDFDEEDWHIKPKVTITMVVMKRAYRFRAYPSKNQQVETNLQLHLAKELYNALLQKSKDHFKDTGKIFTEYDMNRWITKFKKSNPEYNRIHSQVLQNISDRVARAYRNFFRRVKEKHNGKRQKVGFPRFRKFVSSLTYPQAGGFCMERKRIALSKIGRINIVNHREIDGTPTTCTIKKTGSGEWYIAVTTEKNDIVVPTNGKPLVGIDLGLEKFVVLSDGSTYQNAKISPHQRNHLRKLQNGISRSAKGSNNRKKLVLRFARYAGHLSQIRYDFLHKLSHDLVNSYSFIAYEELNIARMVKNHHLAKSISESSWKNFTQLLQYKAESAGCVAIGVNPRYTSQTCSECGNMQKIRLSQRIFNCESCGMSKDRDVNAAQNILKRATEGHSGSQASGDYVRPSSRKAVVAERGTTLVVS